MSKPLVLYYDDVSPPVRSCLLLIKKLNIDVECKYINLFKGEHLSEEFLKINPLHTVPALVHDDLTLTDSHTILMHICDQFENNGDGKELWPKNYKERLKVLNMLFFESSLLFRRDSEFMSDIIRKGFTNIDLPFHERKILESYTMMEKLLKQSKFMACNHMTLADISIVTTLSTVNLMFPCSRDRWPLLSNWFQLMKTMPEYSINQKGLEKLRAIVEQIGKFKFPSSNENEANESEK